MRNPVLLVCLLMASPGCGSSPSSRPPAVDAAVALVNRSCTLTITAGSASSSSCIDYQGLTADQATQVQAICTNGSAPIGDLGVDLTTVDVWSTTPCPRTNVLVGCRLGAFGDLTETLWYYSGAVYTVETVTATCQAAHGTIVTP